MHYVSIFNIFITILFVTRLLLGFWIDSVFLSKRKGWFGVKKESIKDITDTTIEEPRLFNRELNIVKHRKKFFMGSIILIILGAASILIFQLNPGIDFTSGSRIEILSDADNKLTAEEIEIGRAA